jgi:branched-chain amino acid transport system substrate-binding protein
MVIGVKRLLAAAALAASPVLMALPAAGEDIVSVPNMSYRTGPFASTGTPLMNGQRDYMMMINERDGGINGVRLGYEECETGYSTEKGVECYERTKATGIVTQPWSTGIALQVLPKVNADSIPILAPGYGFSPMADGRVFKWAFNPPVTYWDGVSMILRHVSGGDANSLRGKKIALLYLDAPYGTEPIPLLRSLAERHGFSFLPVPVSVREMQNQTSHWRKIGEENPDLVLLWGWGTMNETALAEAVKTKFPMQKLVGIWWSGHDGDLTGLGAAAAGYRSLSWTMPVSDAAAMLDIKKYVLDPKKTEIGAGEFDWVFYQRGVLISMFTVEAIRLAQEHFNSKIVNAEQVRWGFENLKLDEDRLHEIGMTGMIAPFSLSCRDHSGNGSAWMLEWDGSRFTRASDVLYSDQLDVAPLMESEARKYAGANAPWPMNDGCPP